MTLTFCSISSRKNQPFVNEGLYIDMSRDSTNHFPFSLNFLYIDKETLCCGDSEMFIYNFNYIKKDNTPFKRTGT